MIGNKLKQQVIWQIDAIQERWPTFKKVELNTLRSKYIYKDISYADYKTDLIFLKRINGEWNYWYLTSENINENYDRNYTL